MFSSFEEKKLLGKGAYECLDTGAFDPIKAVILVQSSKGRQYHNFCSGRNTTRKRPAEEFSSKFAFKIARASFAGHTMTYDDAFILLSRCAYICTPFND